MSSSHQATAHTSHELHTTHETHHAHEAHWVETWWPALVIGYAATLATILAIATAGQG